MARTHKNITLGTAGHIDHGKTALIKLLTGCDTDRLKAEKERGISIELGFALCHLADLEVGIVDVPGHENFIKTMVAGASGIDATILVVAADDGVMPQTQEHLDILTLLGVETGVVALTKIDRVSDSRRGEAIEELEVFLEGTLLEGAPILPVSAITGDGFEGFYEGLKELVGRLTPKTTDGLFRLPVERTFTIKGYGSVISGVPVSGQAHLGDELVVYPYDIKGRLKAAQVYQDRSDVVRCGQCAALNVPQWDARTLQRGDVVTVPGYFKPESWYLCRLDALASSKRSLKHGGEVKFHTGTAETMAHLYLLEGKQLIPGQQQLIQVHLTNPIVAGPGDRFILRSHAPAQTIGGGLIVEALDRKLRRSRPEILADAQARAQAADRPLDFVVYCLKTTPQRALTVKELCQRAKLAPAQGNALVQQLEDTQQAQRLGHDLVMHTDQIQRGEEALAGAVEAYHESYPHSPGLDLQACRQELNLSKDVSEFLIKRLCAQGRLTIHHERLANAQRTTSFGPVIQARIDKVEAAYTANLFRPPRLQDLPTSVGLSPGEINQTVTLLAEHQRLVRVDHDMYFHQSAIEQAKQAVIAYCTQEGHLESVHFKYLVDTTRKFAIPLLDYLDKIQITRRATDNTRYLGSAVKKEGLE